MKLLLTLVLCLSWQGDLALAAPKKPASKVKKSEKKSVKKMKSEDKAAELKEKEKSEAQEVAQEKIKIVVPTRAKKLEARAGITLWQEPLEAVRNSVKGKMNAQSEGLALSLSYDKPFPHSRWSYTYGADFGVGFIKASSADGVLADTLKNQRWVCIGGSVGIMNRTTVHTSFGFEFPVFYRTISWELNDETFAPDRETSFSAGLGLVYENHFSGRSSLHMSMTHQYMWDATVWLAAYQYKIW